MRAATLIVGAIAAASILIALAFILSGGDSGQQVVTKTVTEKVEAPAPVKEESSNEAGGGAQIGGPTQCGKELSVENVSCEVGEQVHAAFEEGHRGNFFPEEDGETIAMVCKGEAPVECTDGEGAVVYFGG